MRVIWQPRIVGILLLLCILPIAVVGGEEDFTPPSNNAAPPVRPVSQKDNQEANIVKIDAQADIVTEQLFQQYVLQGGKINTATVNAAIELVAFRGYKHRDFVNTVLSAFDKSCRTKEARYNKRNLLAVLTKMLARDGSFRWQYEYEQRTGESGQRELPRIASPINGPESVSPVDGNYPKSVILDRVIAQGRQADRHDIDNFVLAVRAAHHPDGKEFLFDVLKNTGDDVRPDLAGNENTTGKWPDNVGGGWGDAKYYAAAGLAELGEHEGMEWLIIHADWKYGSSLREGCLSALADLTGQKPTLSQDQWKEWWVANKEKFVPIRSVNFKIN